MRKTLVLPTMSLALCLAGCGERTELPDPAAALTEEAENGDDPAELVPGPPEDPISAPLPADRVRADPLPEEIYYSLDEFEWYRQALPIVHEGRTFEAADTVLVLSTLEVDTLGRFGGVLYWARPVGPPPDTLFVPVFEGYWLPFVTRDTAG